jgi:predicted nuclease of predicted toxin-antitoxin system
VPDQICFLLDEHVPSAVTNGLRQRGVDAISVQDAGQCGLADLDLLQFAKMNGRVLVTFDTDFLALASKGMNHAGVVWCTASKYKIGPLIQSLMLVHAALTPDGMRNHVEYI